MQDPPYLQTYFKENRGNFPFKCQAPVKSTFCYRFISISLQITREVQCTQMAAGQNKNQTVFLFLAHMQWSGTYDVIHHKYLVIHFPDTGTIKKRS